MWSKLRSERGVMDVEGFFPFMLIFCLLAAFVLVGVDAYEGASQLSDRKERVREIKVANLEKTFPGVNFTLSRTHTAVTYFADPPHNTISCRAGVDGWQYANRYEIKVRHQRGACRLILEEATK